MGDQQRWLQKGDTGRIASQLQRHMQVSTKCTAKSILHCTDDRMHQFAIKSPWTRGEREREALGLVLQKSIPQREETLSITTFSLFQTLSVIFMTPAIHLVLESKRTGGERGLPRTSYGC